MKEKKLYLNIVFTVVVSYILIKFIDNYKYFFNVINLLLSFLTPFVIAFILAYIFNPIVVFLEKNLKFKSDRYVAIFQLDTLDHLFNDFNFFFDSRFIPIKFV